MTENVAKFENTEFSDLSCRLYDRKNVRCTTKTYILVSENKFILLNIHLKQN